MTASTGEATLFFGNPWGGAGNGRVRAELPSIFSRLIWASLCFCFYETDQALSICCCEHVCGSGGCLRQWRVSGHGMAALCWELWGAAPRWGEQTPSRFQGSVGIITSGASLRASLLGN